MKYNIAKLAPDAIEKIQVDLVAAAVAFRERYKMPVILEQLEREQLVHLRDYFRERVVFYRQCSLNFSCLPYKSNK